MTLFLFLSLLLVHSIAPDPFIMDEFSAICSSLLAPADNDWLLAPVLLDEVKQIVYIMDPDTAPGSNGFSGAFFSLLLGHCRF